MPHCSQDLINIFNELFKDSEQTLVQGGGHEPLYLPQSEVYPFNRIIFTHDYYASALHEIAHWCIAGQERRKLVDYGYWYKPDGRSLEQQELFEQVEVKPQALEWIFTLAAGVKFHISQDNLAGGVDRQQVFKAKVYNQVLLYFEQGLPPRAELFKNKLLAFYRREGIFERGLFAVEGNF